MQESYKLVYFNLRALAEPIRFIFAFKEILYENKCINSLEWEDLKKDYRWGQLPELHINGKTMISQATGISRYLARKYDLMPSDNLEATRCDEIVDALQDLRIRVKPFVISKYFYLDGKEAELKKQLLEKDFPHFLPNINDIVLGTQNNAGLMKKGSFIFGNRISWADFWLAHFTSIWEETIQVSDLLKDYPVLKLQQEAVMAIPQIKSWIDIRPQTLI